MLVHFVNEDTHHEACILRLLSHYYGAQFKCLEKLQPALDSQDEIDRVRLAREWKGCWGQQRIAAPDGRRQPLWQPAAAGLSDASPSPSAAAAASQPAAGNKAPHTSHYAPASAQSPPAAELQCHRAWFSASKRHAAHSWTDTSMTCNSLHNAMARRLWKIDAACDLLFSAAASSWIALIRCGWAVLRASAPDVCSRPRVLLHDSTAHKGLPKKLSGL